LWSSARVSAGKRSRIGFDMGAPSPFASVAHRPALMGGGLGRAGRA